MPRRRSRPPVAAHAHRLVQARRVADPDDLHVEARSQLADLAVVLVGGRVRAPPSRRESPAFDAFPPRSARCSSAARIESGFALYASLTTNPPPGSSTSSPRQGDSRIPGTPVGGAIERQPERRIRMERGERVHGEMPLRERELELDRLPRRRRTWSLRHSVSTSDAEKRRRVDVCRDRGTARARRSRPARPPSRPPAATAIASAFASATRSTDPRSSRCSGPM